MELPHHPIVSPLPPSPSIPKDHHGPWRRRRVSLPDDGPSYFRNPWKSYRTASLTDAWLAYQKGAAIAPHQPRSAAPSRPSSRASTSQAPDLEDESEDDDEDEPLVGAGTSTKSKGYVRPEFSTWHEEDHEDDWRDPPLEVVPPRWDEVGEDRPNVTWLGHAGVLVQIPWKRKAGGREGMCGVLFDPIFSYRCSPSQYIGPARYLEPPCTVADLPDIHVCCISHDHYDHLDYYTIMDLWRHHQSTIHFFVPSGLKAWFIASGIPPTRVSELDWYHETLVSFPSSPPATPSITAPPEPSLHYPPHDTPTPRVDPDAALILKIAFTPAQHRSGRGVFDHMTTLWGSWCVGVVEEGDAKKASGLGMKAWEGFNVFFGGDTGYRYATAPEGDLDAICPAFQHIADLYSPFNLSLLPLSTGSSLPFLRTLLSLSLDQYTLTSSLHCSPSDSLDIHRILSAERTVGIHWGTFCDADEARGTRVEFGRRRRDMGVSGRWEGEGEHEEGNRMGRFVVADIGETLVIP